MSVKREFKYSTLGSFGPVQDQQDKSTDEQRLINFKAAIEYAVFPGAKVVELGGGSGMLSWFAASLADKVWCVEFNSGLVEQSKDFMAKNVNGHKVQIVHADAFDFLPPEQVDVVICEMTHVGMLREKQIEMVESFKRRYLKRFVGAALPLFIPEAAIMAVQPLQQDYNLGGYNPSIAQFQRPFISMAGIVEMANPAVYSMIDFNQPNDLEIAWEGQFVMEKCGTVNALRFITKNILAVVQEQDSTIDLTNEYMLVSLATPVNVLAGDVLDVSFQYRAGGSISSMRATIQASVVQTAEVLDVSDWLAAPVYA